MHYSERFCRAWLRNKADWQIIVIAEEVEGWNF